MLKNQEVTKLSNSAPGTPHGLMRKWRLSNLWKYLTLAALVVFGLHSLYGNSVEKSRRLEIPSGEEQWKRQCMEPTNSLGEVYGLEGNLDRPLRALIVLFRHGERSPLDTIGNVNGCYPSREEDRRNFDEYARLHESEQLKYFIKTDKEFLDNGFKRVPGKAKCVSGLMTAGGALSVLRVGSYFHKKYGKSSLFSSTDHKVDVDITATPYNRTFQSAVAFTTGFLWPLQEQFPQLFIKAANNSWACTLPECVCPNGKKYRRKYEKENEKLFREEAPDTIRNFVSDLMKNLPAFENVSDPYRIMDVALGSYICRQRSLPCLPNGDCLTYNRLTEMLNYTTMRAKYTYESGDKFISRRLQLFEAFGVLSQVRRTAALLRKFPHTNIVKLFAAHDSTVAPLLRVLGVPLIDTPQYVSRIVFEVYEGENVDDLLVRVLNNGDDVTSDVQPCAPHLLNGLCPMFALEAFISKIPSLLKSASVPEFCTSNVHLL